MQASTSVPTDIGHILLVDDEDDCNFVTRLVLKKAGHTGRLTCFTSADEALAYLRNGTEAPDIMFVDINMPKLTGFDLLTICESEGLLPNGCTVSYTHLPSGPVRGRFHPACRSRRARGSLLKQG